MKIKRSLTQIYLRVTLLLALLAVPATATPVQTNRTAIPFNQIGAVAGQQYVGDGLSVTPDGNGARLHCVFQQLDGEATREGLWLTSTVTNQANDRFRVVAIAMGRRAASGTTNSPQTTSNIFLNRLGTVTVEGQVVRYNRAGLVEEYVVSMDGVRQDFLVTERPAGDGQLTMRLAVSGARVESAADGAQLVLEKSGRKIAYSRLRATDATGKELPARIEVRSGEPALAVIVNDAGAVYPVRIDPTFSDANWMSCFGTPGLNSYFGQNSSVSALVVSGDTLYVGGYFGTVGGNAANFIAQWNGCSWSALGSGMDATVSALAVSGNMLYAGGGFARAGGVEVSCIAQWNGSSWSPLGSGVNGWVNALAVSGGTLYAGGGFTTAGGVSATNIAQWNGSSWAPLGSGMNYTVNALAVSGGTLHAGGSFTNAGGTTANYIAQWNGSSWSALGSGMGGVAFPSVSALAVSDGTLYAGGAFTTAGGKVSAYVAEALLGWPAFSSAPVFNSDGSLTLQMSTLSPSTNRLYAATNLASPVVWQPIYTNWTGGLWQFTDTNASGNQAKFYRLSTP